MEWYEEFGFDKDPFELDPLKTDYPLIGRDKESKEVTYRISSDGMLVIEGKNGSGKTAILKHAIDNFKGEGKVIYVDGKLISKRLNITNLIDQKPKGMILLLDNVQALSELNNDRIKYYYDNERIKSVIFTTTDYSLTNISDALKHRIGRNIINLKNLTPDEAVRIVQKRLGKSKMLPNDVIIEAYNESESLTVFLRLCRTLCRYIHHKGKKQATIEDLQWIRLVEKREIKDAEICQDCKKLLVKAGKTWRCTECDRFCKSCGTILSDDQTKCPACGKEAKK